MGFALILGFCTAAPASVPPGLMISEVLADPTFASDAAAEYIEICATGSESLNLGDHVLRVDGRAFPLPAQTILSGQAFLLCRDTAAAIAQELPCKGSLPGLSLANGRALMLELLSSRDTAIYVLPASRPGEAQQNQGLGLDQPPIFQPSRQPYRGDFATPGQCWDTLSQAGEAPDWGAPAPEDLKKPWMSASQLTLRNGESLTLGFPEAYAGGSLRIMAASGEEVFAQRLSQGVARLQWDGRGHDRNWVKPGPYVIIAISRGRIWRRACLAANP